MDENRVLVLLFGLVTACTLATTIAFLMTAGDLRRILRQLHQLLTRADQTAAQVQSVAGKACDAAETALEQLSFLKGKVVSLWSGRAGNGGGRPRSRKMVRIDH